MGVVQEFLSIEIRPSAGFNLNWCRYDYWYGEDSGFIGQPQAAGSLETKLQSKNPIARIDFSMLLASMAMRSGVETHPLNLNHPADTRWLKALTWPDHYPACPYSSYHSHLN